MDDFLTFATTSPGRYIVWGVFGVLTATVAYRKGYRVLPWFIAGVVFSFIAFIVILCKGSNREGLERRSIREGSAQRCPKCAELIRPEAKVCRFCGTDLGQPVSPAASV